MKKYWILWTYIANHSEKPFEVKANSAREASELLLECYSEDFRKKAKLYVFDREPVFTYNGREHS